MQKNLRENTLIIFASDNGGATGNASDNGIYRGMKGSKWEGGHRVPCIVNWPAGGITGGKRNGMLTSTLDFMATSLDVAGQKGMIKELDLDGISLLPGLKKVAGAEDHDTLYSRRSVVQDYAMDRGSSSASKKRTRASAIFCLIFPKTSVKPRILVSSTQSACRSSQLS